MPSRRQVLSGAASLGASAVGAAFGSGAFTQTEADRDFDLELVGDEQGLLTIDPNVDVSPVVQIEDGRVRFDSDDIAGNPNATLTIGELEHIDFGSPGEIKREAFALENNTDRPISVVVEVGAVDSESELKLGLADDTGSGDTADAKAGGAVGLDGTDEVLANGNNEIDELDVETIEPGNSVVGAFVIDSAGSGENLDTTIQVRAFDADNI